MKKIVIKTKDDHPHFFKVLFTMLEQYRIRKMNKKGEKKSPKSCWKMVKSQVPSLICCNLKLSQAKLSKVKVGPLCLSASAGPWDDQALWSLVL